MLKFPLVISCFAFKYILIVENIKPMMDANNENIKYCGFISIMQLLIPNATDKNPDNLKRFMFIKRY